MPYYRILIVQSEEGTLLHSAREEVIHIVLIQVCHAVIALIFLVIYIVDTCVTIHCHRLLLRFFAVTAV
jgi:hypothetical protein